jgi:hypothetical protein
MVRPSWPLVPTSAPRRVTSRRAWLAVLTALLTVAGCERSAGSGWADTEPIRTATPSPLALSPSVPYDTTLAADDSLSVFLRMQDRLREAGAVSMLEAIADSMPEAAEPLSVTKAVATSSTSATVGGGQDATDHAQHGVMAALDGPGALLGDGAEPQDPARCARSLRVVSAPGRGEAAVWWTRASGGRVHLVGAWRDATGGTSASGAWRGPLVIDTLDQGPGDAQAAERGAHGCARPAPSVVFDVRTAFLHVAYAVRGPEGSGVFYAHQMDPRAPFEPPTALLYGEQLGTVRVASDGDVVAVVYEDPNARGRSRVGLALSRTAGHSFDDGRLIASGDAGTARDPYVVVKGRAVVTGWSDVTDPAAPVFIVRRLRVAPAGTAR